MFRFETPIRKPAIMDESHSSQQDMLRALMAEYPSLSPFPLLLLSPSSIALIGNAINSSTIDLLSTNTECLSDQNCTSSNPQSTLFSSSISPISSSPLSSSSSFTYSNQTAFMDKYPADISLDTKGGLLLTVNIVTCLILISLKAIQYLIFGPLRCNEEQHLRETLLDYTIQKAIFIFFILDTKTHVERLSWLAWFATLGFVLIPSKLCKDRFEYLSASPTTKAWPLIKISLLMSLLLVISLCCTFLIPMQEINTLTLFYLADSAYVLTFVLSVITRFILLSYEMRPDSMLEKSATLNYYSELIFSFSMLIIEFLHHLHLFFMSHASMIIRFICLMKVHTLMMEIQRRYKRHRHYMVVVQLMESNFTTATKEEIENFCDECAICWDRMESARKLPCGHLFHNSCLRSWLDQDTSCPTCRTSFKSHHKHLSQSQQHQSQSNHHQQLNTHRAIVNANTQNTHQAHSPNNNSRSHEQLNHHNGRHQHTSHHHHHTNDDLMEFVLDDSSSDGESDSEVVPGPHQRNHLVLFHFDSSRYTNHRLLRWLPRISIDGFI